MKTATAAKNLGCYLDDHTDPKLELRHRFSTTVATWKRSFQLKGLGKILRMQTTYVSRANTNAK
eukprot:10535511-Prorocentrum_lima.AAC.1